MEHRYKIFNSQIKLVQAKFKNYRYPRHWHEEYAIGVMQHGIGGLEINKTLEQYPTNSIVLINPKEIHTGFSFFKNDEFYYTMLYIGKSMFFNLLNLPESSALFFNSNKIINKNACYRISSIMSSLTYDISSSSMENKVSEMLKYVSDYLKISNENYNLEKTNLYKIKMHIEKNYKETIEIAELMEEVGLSRSHLIREFTKQYGISPHEYQIQLKIQQAKILLTSGIKPVDVAYELGFCDQSHLTRWIKKVFLLTPNEFYLKNSTNVQY